MPQPTPRTYVPPTPAAFLRSLPDDALRSEFAVRGLDEAVALDRITPKLIRGARGLLDWTLNDLADASRVSVSTVKRREDVLDGQVKAKTDDAIRTALEAAGVRFVVLHGAPALLLAAPQPRKAA